MLNLKGGYRTIIILFKIFSNAEPHSRKKNKINKKQQQHLSRVAYVTGEVINEHAQRLYSLRHRHRVPSGFRVTSPAVAQARALLH